MEPVLLVEDKPELRAMLRKALERCGYAVEEAPDGNAAIDKVRARRYLLVLSDLKLPGSSGLDVLREARRVEPTLPVILVTAYGSVEEAVTAMKEGAFDFIQKPVDLDHLKLLLDRAAKQQELLRENLLLREEYAARYGFPRIVAEHPSHERREPDDPARGRDRFHGAAAGRKRHGQRTLRARHPSPEPAREHPFVALNCAAIPEGLVENELFGHERGAYTGARAREKSASSSSRIAERCSSTKLASCRWRFKASCCACWRNSRFERVGGTQEIEVNVRILTATNKDLRAAVADKTFREDLYFRISAVPITIPPLRDRGDDVLLLAEHFLERFKREFRKPALALTEDARARLRTYPWPGNVRELQNAIERAAILANGSDIDAARCNCLPRGRLPSNCPSDMLEDEFLWEGPLEEVSQRAVAHVERFKIQNALRESKWNKTRAAEKLGVSYKTLLHKIRALGLDN